MIEISYISPLKVPKNHTLSYQRQRRYDNGFPQGLTIDQAVQYLEEELRALDATRIAVYTNYDRLNSERNRAKRDDDSAVCCEIHLGTRKYYLICDRWYLLEHNLYALHLSIRAWRNIVKWGVADMEMLLAGFDAAGTSRFEAGSDNGSVILPEWMITLGINMSASLDDANHAYRQLAKQSANDESRLLHLNQAIESARKYYGA